MLVEVKKIGIGSDRGGISADCKPCSALPSRNSPCKLINRKLQDDLHCLTSCISPINHTRFCLLTLEHCDLQIIEECTERLSEEQLTSVLDVLQETYANIQVRA